jgi:hypothetical protein
MGLRRRFTDQSLRCNDLSCHGTIIMLPTSSVMRESFRLMTACGFRFCFPLWVCYPSNIVLPFPIKMPVKIDDQRVGCSSCRREAPRDMKQA